MKNLISKINLEENNPVNARELHEFMKVGRDFTNWMKGRISDYNFIENEDFEVYAKTGENLQGGRPTKEYAISMDMAKELAMVERSEKGREIRKYFIEAEKQYRNQLANKQKKRGITAKATVNDDTLYSQKLASTMILAVNKEGVPFFQMTKLAKFLGFPATSLAKRVPKHTVIKFNTYSGSKTFLYFINKEGVDNLLTFAKHDLISADVDALYQDLFRITLEGKKSTRHEFPYKFTHEEIATLLLLVSEIGKLGIQNDISKIIRGGRK